MLKRLSWYNNNYLVQPEFVICFPFVCWFIEGNNPVDVVAKWLVGRFYFNAFVLVFLLL